MRWVREAAASADAICSAVRGAGRRNTNPEVLDRQNCLHSICGFCTKTRAALALCVCSFWNSTSRKINFAGKPPF